MLAAHGLTWGYAVITLVEAAAFWNFSRNQLTPLPLFFLCCGSLTLHLATTLFNFNYWWAAFWMNRLFELSLLYIAGCALFRIVRIRQKRKGAPAARPRSSEIFAAA